MSSVFSLSSVPEAPDLKTMWLLGVDEAGRGCLAGPVSAVALLAPPGYDFSVFTGLTDSKKLSAKARAVLAQSLRESGLLWGLGQSWPEEIDRVNILNASFRAMSRAVLAVAAAMARRNAMPDPEQILLCVDGPFAIPFAQWHGARHCPIWRNPPRQLPLIRGDAILPVISAASILVKTRRDKLMQALHRRYPQYALAGHKGYATALHLEKLALHGLSRLHRKSFHVRSCQVPEQWIGMR